ncbi:related to regulatory protein involved in control of sterol uptake [Phialocephala subalpina]|uniref:Related to regulatory protein involved in control of sterol uptake n=1 Tax=Phialocephala subalpina TaxID=576137 RepID=A0A1L7WF36_9HELO|nr:related to regulatory protein involved in control of sterol uptake [Phialocephala subalpina]
MAHKRAHNKSRNGCDQCKARHIKCDERGPPCTTCVSRHTDCHYSRLTASRSSTSRAIPNAISDPARDRPAGSPINMASTAIASTSFSNEPLPPSTRLRELELMHHWCTKTCHGFTSRLSDLFQGYVVEEAVKHDFLMESILALTCLHIASKQEDRISAANYASEGLRYQNNAVRPFHTALHDVTPSNCHAVFACSVVTMACTIVSPLLPTSNHEKATSTMESFLPLFDFVKGISSVVDISREWLEVGPLGAMFHIKALGAPEGVATIRPPFQRLRALVMNNTVTGEISPIVHKIYLHTIDQLEVATIKNNAVTWLGFVGKEFIEQLRMRKPLALIIFMYWGVLLDRMEELWWAKYLGKRLVEELSEDLIGRGKEWEEATRWVIILVGSGALLSSEFESNKTGLSG